MRWERHPLAVHAPSSARLPGWRDPNAPSARVIAATVELDTVPVVTASSAELVNFDPICREYHAVRLESTSMAEAPARSSGDLAITF